MPKKHNSGTLTWENYRGESIRWVKWTKKHVMTKVYIHNDLFKHITTMSKPSCVISYAAQRYLARIDYN